jgi:hypothetical protein
MNNSALIIPSSSDLPNAKSTGWLEAQAHCGALYHDQSKSSHRENGTAGSQFGDSSGWAH